MATARGLRSISLVDSEAIDLDIVADHALMQLLLSRPFQCSGLETLNFARLVRFCCRSGFDALTDFADSAMANAAFSLSYESGGRSQQPYNTFRSVCLELEYVRSVWFPNACEVVGRRWMGRISRLLVSVSRNSKHCACALILCCFCPLTVSPATCLI